jgi:hypothetical protein
VSEQRHGAAKWPLGMSVKNCCIITKGMGRSCRMEGDYLSRDGLRGTCGKELKPSDIHRRLSVYGGRDHFQPAMCSNGTEMAQSV